LETISSLLGGFDLALSQKSLLFVLLGCVWGTIVGVLPGLGPLAGMALLLPFTFRLDPATAIMMLAGIFCGAMYGGSTTSILLRVPGEAASVITCIDGYAMTQQGRAGPALVIAAIGSFIGGTASVVGLMLVGPRLADAMLLVGPAADFVLMLLALAILSTVSSGSRLKTVIMILVGLGLCAVGSDPLTAWPRYSFGILQLNEGIDFVPAAIGLLGVSEVFLALGTASWVRPIAPRLSELLPRLRDLREAGGSIARGSLIGFVFGIIPGAGHIMSTFVSYAVEKRVSRRPELFGKGAIQGVAGPEAANNATTGSCLIPLLILGIPSIPSTAILLSALLIHGVQAGPQLLSEHPEVFWGLVASLYVANLVLLILNLPLVGLFVNLLRIPYPLLATFILIFCVFGVYSVSQNIFHVYLMIGFGIAGYFLRRCGFDPAPLVLALVLGEKMEVGFRRALTISNGDYTIFFRGPAARFLLVACLLLVVLQVVAWVMGYRREVDT
jgi:putative tricarboxylic transport membrane protein